MNRYYYSENHSNAFVDLNGVPYVLGEYLDRRNFQQIDSSMIRNDLFIDTREPMRTIVDIAIDDIGKRASDGYPAIQGNNTKQRNLINMANQMADRLNHQFDVLRRGLIVRICYQLENKKSGTTIRSMIEDLRIWDRNYFVEINPRDIDDNAVIVNFSNSMVSNISEFTHGRSPMMLRITQVQMFYECPHRDGGIPKIKSHLPVKELDYYNYHDQIQNHHIFGPGGCRYEGYGHEPVDAITSPTWTMFNRYYHFDYQKNQIVLHDREIMDPHVPCALVPCGTVQINRTFLINPCQRIVFKFTVWKNDVTVVNDAIPLAQAIEAPHFYPYEPIPHVEHHYHHGLEHPRPSIDTWEDHRDHFLSGYPWNQKPHKKKHKKEYEDDYEENENTEDQEEEETNSKKKHHHKRPPKKEDPVPETPTDDSKYEELLKALEESQRINDQQTELISGLIGTVNALKELITSYHPEIPNEEPDSKDPDGEDDPPDDPTEEPTEDPKDPNCGCDDAHQGILDSLKKLEDLLNSMMNSKKPEDSSQDSTEEHEKLQEQIEQLRQELEELKNSDADESIKEQLDKISAAIEALSEKLDSDECCNIQVMTTEMVNDLINKIQNSDY